MAFFCVVLPGLGFLAILIYGCVLGLEAFRNSRTAPGPHQLALRFLALNLCEPLINTILVTWLLKSTSLNEPNLLATTPMVILVVPALGLRLTDQFYREKSAAILVLGLARWGLNLTILALHSSSYAKLDLLLVPCAFGLFIFSIFWGKSQLRGPLATPQFSFGPSPRQVTPIAIQVPASQSARVAAPPATPIYHQPSIPLDPRTSVRCPICHEPTACTAKDCPSCGLVFSSRVPAALQAISGYMVLRPLSAGGMSSVYLARQPSGKLCVLKTHCSVDTQNAGWQAEALACLQREAELLAQIDHPRVARLIERVHGSAGDALVLEYIAGPTLEQHLTRLSAHGVMIPGAALPPRQALAYGISVTETLGYLARLPQPVVHCDIKPANLILPPGGNAPVLVDFGGALLHDSQLQTVRLERYGTPGYAAPEQYQGLAGPQSDVYGLAATLYHLLTNDDPCGHPLSFPALAQLPSDLAAVLESALANDPQARPDAVAFGTALGRL